MRLLITRPAANAAVLAEKLAAQGHNIIISPVIDIFPTDTPLPKSADAFAALALTSANGVHALATRCLNDQALRAAWQSLPAYAVGPQTAATLKAYGWPHILQADGDVDSLASLIVEKISSPKKPILHLAGRDRAGNLQAALAAENIACDLVMLYEAEPAEVLSPAAEAALSDAEEPIDGVLIYSQRSARLFIALCAPISMVHKPLAYCLSPAIAEIMQAAGFETRTAAQADEASMLVLTKQAPS